jgi:hypothetical protein
MFGIDHGADRLWPRLCIPSESAGIRRNPCKKGPSGKNVKVRSTGMCYNTILDISVCSGWYLSTWFLHVDKSWEHENVFSLVAQLVCCWVGGERNKQPSMGAAKVMDRTAAGEGWR